MKKSWVRWLLTVGLVYAVLVETGPWTATAVGLLFAAGEIAAHLVMKAMRE